MTQVNIKTHVRARGFYRIQVKSAEGKLKSDTGWFENLITDQGLDWFGTPPPNTGVSYTQQIICTHCAVGTGNTTPATTDTQLVAQIAKFPPTANSNVEGFTTSSYVAGPPAYWSGIFTYNFGVGAVVGNIAEVGVGNNAADPAPPTPPPPLLLFSRALIMVGGVPGTISVLSTDALTVTYELRLYLDLTTNPYSFQISGVTYSGNYLRALVGTVPNYYTILPYDINGAGYIAYVYAYSGAVGTVTTQPSGSTDSFDSNVIVGGYTLGSYTLIMNKTASLSRCNFAAYINAFMIGTKHESWQFSVSPAIPKTSTYTLTFNWTMTWARY